MNRIMGKYADLVKIITPDDGMHYFFGYYDMKAADETGRHLAHRVSFINRLPTENDEAELGYVMDGEFFAFAKTTAWNFQQGAMLQFHPCLKDTVIYNSCVDSRFVSVIHNINTGEKRYTDRPTACISPNGKFGLAVNFGRIYDFRPGYGYAGFKDEYVHINAPKEDGVFLVDLDSGKSKQIVSYDKLAPAAGFEKEEKILINHITFNTSSDRFIMLTRNFPKDGCDWKSSVVIGDLFGNMKTVLKKTYFSHYFWVSSNELLAHCTVDGSKKSMYLINTDTCTCKELPMPYFEKNGNRDIHCSCRPFGNYIIGDGYPLDGYRYLMALNTKSMEEEELFRAKTIIPECADIRCDLHTRYISDDLMSFDTTHNGKREIAVLNTKLCF